MACMISDMHKHTQCTCTIQWWSWSESDARAQVGGGVWGGFAPQKNFTICSCWRSDFDAILPANQIPTSLLLVLVVLSSVAEQLCDVGVVPSSPWLDSVYSHLISFTLQVNSSLTITHLNYHLHS